MISCNLQEITLKRPFDIHNKENSRQTRAMTSFSNIKKYPQRFVPR
jgi:hypothetical protein